MPKNIYIYLGLLIAVLPAVSIPGSYKNWIYFIFGILIAVMSYYQIYYKKKVMLKGAAQKRALKRVTANSPQSDSSVVENISVADDVDENVIEVNEDAETNKQQ